MPHPPMRCWLVVGGGFRISIRTSKENMGGYKWAYSNGIKETHVPSINRHHGSSLEKSSRLLADKASIQASKAAVPAATRGEGGALDDARVNCNVTMDLGCMVDVIRNLPSNLDYYWLNEQEMEAFHRVAQLASIGFCRNISRETFECGKNCKYFQTLKLVRQFSTRRYDVNGYVAYDRVARTIAIGFSGAISWKNWVQVAKSRPIAYSSAGEKATVHRGFQQAYTEARGVILDAVRLVLKQYPHFQIVVTGHSFGSALATLCAADVYRSFPPSMGLSSRVQLVTLGQPRIGNKPFARYIASLPINPKRVVQQYDPVPHMPRLRESQWYQSGTEVWFQGSTEGAVQCLPEESLLCSRGKKDHKSIDHLTYIGVRMAFDLIPLVCGWTSMAH
ncbi:uncharacterized protein VTP21DRAFT_5037 [Calcarisporiella thermophila]|uniref:uncharacterized protein n=1 Tax=Calcarisporiella thermophila TaxID=911321 RepID=UPI00374407F5